MSELITNTEVGYGDTSLNLPKNMPYDEWEQVGKTLQHMGRSVQWWIGDWINYGESKYGEKYSQAIDLTGASLSMLQKCAWVANKIETCNRLQVLSWTHHEQVASLEPVEQKHWLAEAADNSWTIRDLKKALKASRIAATPELPADKFNLILADPPWKYDFAETDNRKIENHYPTMDQESLCGLKVPSADSCLLLLWATAPKLAEAFEVIEAWGFRYKTCAVWDKEKIGMGYWFRGQHELLMVATKSTVEPPEESSRVSSVFREPRSKHSTKPVCVYKWIESAFPSHKKCEMFARRERQGWTVWGNEV